MYGSKILSPTSKLLPVLPPPSIRIVLFLLVIIKVQYHLPTSTQYIFKSCGIKQKVNKTKMLVTKIVKILFLYCLNLYL